MKQFRFNLDKTMKAKLYCKLHSHKNDSMIPQIPCLWMYLLDVKSLISWINDQTFREKSIVIERDRYFSKNEGEVKWKIREEKKDELINVFKEIIQDEKYIESIESVLKIDMKDLKIL